MRTRPGRDVRVVHRRQGGTGVMVVLTQPIARSLLPQVQVMQATAKEMKTQFKSKDLNINAIDKMTDEMARRCANRCLLRHNALGE